MMKLLFALQIDCEATQHSIHDAALGERAIRGLGEVLRATGTRGTFLVIPGDMEIHAPLYRELEAQGHEIGLHVHPAEMGYDEFLGVQSAAMQRRIISEAIERFSQAMGRVPVSFCPGYASANDATFGVLEELGFTHGMVSIPTRNLPQYVSLWASAPLDPHYPHRYNRSLAGEVNFVELPLTVDPDSATRGSGHLQDLRIELVDAKNHRHIMDKAVTRQGCEGTTLRQLHALTHNVFDYSERNDVRREAYVAMVQSACQIAEREQLEFQPVTLAEMATMYRGCVPLERAASQSLAVATATIAAAPKMPA